MSQPETPSTGNPYAHIDAPPADSTDQEPAERSVEKVTTNGGYL